MSNPRRLPWRSSLISHMDTPYRHILYTNTVASDEEARGIRRLVVAPMQDIQTLTNDIDGLQATIDQLTQQRDQRVHERDVLTEFVEAHLALVSTARTLPEEIVREIFTALLPYRDRYPTMKRTQFPVVLTLICREWRAIALSIPRLWASLHIAAPYLSPWANGQIINDGVKTWLSRSGNLPLSISFVWTASHESEDLTKGAEDRSAILHSLMVYSNRWAHMRFIFPAYESFQSLATLSPADVPQLQTVVIRLGTPIPASSNYFSFAHGINVQGISLKSIVDTHTHALVPQSPIRFLSLLGPTFSLGQVLTMLRQSPQLETCTLSIADGPEPVPPQPVRMVRLRRLCIVDQTRGGNGTTLFRYVELPNLDTLDYSYTMWFTALLPYLATFHNLTSLGLSTRMSKETLAQCLADVPKLEKLVLHRPKISLVYNQSPISCQLFSLLSTEALCPLLRDVSCFGVDAGSDEELLAFVRTRHAGGPQMHTLSRVHCVFPHAMQLEDIAAQVAAEGVTADLRYPTKENQDYMSKPASYEYPATPPREQEDREMDWGPISSSVWVQEYAEWGVTRDIWAKDE
ncbi:hypothetical protein DFH06DRAFT_214218 [Mycena polygramma]|nr:hypothetical protein DFH06DRAFT_214218 [Mycena polygramma]